MDKNTIYKQYHQIAEYCSQLEQAAYDIYKTYPPVSEEEICKWENDNQVSLPEGLRKWYLLSNGFDMSSTADILPINRIKKYPFDDIDELDNCFIVGHYIGDGSMLVIDTHGNFFECDHGYNKLYKMLFEDFLQEWIIDNLEDSMYEAGLL